MSHIINDCPVNKFESGLATLHTASGIPPESGCIKFTAYAKGKEKTEMLLCALM